MKPHVILKDFKGSQNGHDHHEFKAGPDPVLLSNDLAAIVVKEGWAKPLATGGVAPKPARLPFVGETLADSRYTKVVAPEEFKESADESDQPVKKTKKAKG